MNYRFVTRIASVIVIALLGVLAVATVRADDPDAWEFVDLWVAVNKEADADVIEFRLESQRILGGRVVPITLTPENRFVRVHDGWLHYWLPSSPVEVREGLRARIVARLVEQPILTMDLSGKLKGTVGFKLFGSGVEASGEVNVSSDALQWEPSVRMIKIGLQLSFNGGAWTDPLEFKQRYMYKVGSLCAGDIPGLNTALDHLVNDDGEIEVPGSSATIKLDELCIGNGLRSDSWSQTDSLKIPAQLSMFPESGAPEIEPEAVTGQPGGSVPGTQIDIPDESTQTTPPSAGIAGAISANSNHVCAIAADVSISCWGNNGNGQSGAPEGAFSQVSAGLYHTCAVATDSSISCWGYDYYGQINAPGGAFSQVGAGERHTCALATDGSISCWGYNYSGQTVAPFGIFSQVSAGSFYNCAIAISESISCWGWNEHGQGDAPDGTFTQISAGYDHTCALATDGSISCWGNNDHGKSDAPDGAFTQVSAGDNHTCALPANGRGVVCWGLGQSGGVSAPNLSYSAVAAGGDYTCLITTAGAIQCAGKDEHGETSVPAHFRRPGAVSP